MSARVGLFALVWTGVMLPASPLSGQSRIEYNSSYSFSVGSFGAQEIQFDGELNQWLHVVVQPQPQQQDLSGLEVEFDEGAVPQAWLAVSSSQVIKRVYVLNETKSYSIRLSNTSPEAIALRFLLLHPPFESAQEIKLVDRSFSGVLNAPGDSAKLWFEASDTQHLSFQLNPVGDQGITRPRLFFYGPTNVVISEGTLSARVETGEKYYLVLDDALGEAGQYELQFETISQTVSLGPTATTAVVVTSPPGEERYVVFAVPDRERWSIEIVEAPGEHTFALLQPGHTTAETRKTGPEPQRLNIPDITGGQYSLLVKNESEAESRSVIEFQRDFAPSGIDWPLRVQRGLLLLLGSLLGGAIHALSKPLRGRLVFAKNDALYSVLVSIAAGLAVAFFGESLIFLAGLLHEAKQLDWLQTFPAVGLGLILGFASPFTWLRRTVKL